MRRPYLRPSLTPNALRPTAWRERRRRSGTRPVSCPPPALKETWPPLLSWPRNAG
ncbi:hypothetical protein M9458_042997, partial [Cirrhinus mrigala]